MSHVFNTKARRNAVSSHKRVNSIGLIIIPYIMHTLPGLLRFASVKLPNRPPRRGVKMHIQRQGKVAYRVYTQKKLDGRLTSRSAPTRAIARLRRIYTAHSLDDAKCTR